MKADRDSFIIVLTFVPITVALVMFLLWKVSGNGPIDLPSFSFASGSIPSIGPDDVPGLVGLVKLVQGSTQSLKSVAIGIGVGLVGGIIIAGIAVDVIKGARKIPVRRIKGGRGSN